MDAIKCSLPKFDTSTLRPELLTIEFADTSVELPIWTDKRGAIFFSMIEAGRCFGIHPKFVQKSEWLAVHGISAERIRSITHF
jgi:hypothetical protein